MGGKGMAEGVRSNRLIDLCQVRRMADGSQLVVVPELTATGPNNNNDEITVLLLPPNFDAGCR